MHLHSNMVRFIICASPITCSIPLSFTFQYGQIYYPFVKWSVGLGKSIYIPIWLDLLFICRLFNSFWYSYLHSNMVRFIILLNKNTINFNNAFTFQYGQIYYKYGKLKRVINRDNLHSNMVRFIINSRGIRSR